MPSGSKRTAQVGERIRELIATMLIRGEVRDPRVKKVTINKVKVSPDLQIAKVYYSVLGDKAEREGVQLGLTKAAGFIRNAVGKDLDIRYTPEISFYYDDGIDHANHMNEVLNKIKQSESAHVTVDDNDDEA